MATKMPESKCPKQFTCSICNATLREKIDLQAHLATHNGEKNFACDMCEKRYRHRSIDPRLLFIPGANVLIKFHEDRTINVASIVFTRQMMTTDARRTKGDHNSSP
ncbi:hypothetical protein DPMN_126280 [Dreissena polymorpha]|uniref:C2H2-type domain-containing protein n=1 Tax=Dreissena polymorpha TaxID=45954 RepID=A0A9D4GZU8_DREPO|nr:hypothetical protein DPMN_126280 [Dreissena polymorpha]